MASSAPPTPGASESRPAPFTRLGNFWQRVSEGRRIDDLWSQFAADARSSYGFYGKDVDWDEVNQRYEAFKSGKSVQELAMAR